MQRTDLTEATLQGWARLDAAQRHRFFEAFVKAALRLDKLELRAWLRRRLQYPPLAAIDPASFTISDADIALLMRAAREAPGDAAAGLDRDEADGGQNLQAVSTGVRRMGHDPIGPLFVGNFGGVLYLFCKKRPQRSQ